MLVAPHATRMNQAAPESEEESFVLLFGLFLINFWEEVLLGGCCRVRVDMEELGDKQE